MKKIVVIYSEDDWNKKIPMADSPMTRQAFEDWHERGLKNEIAMYRASLNWFDAKRLVFRKAWAYRNKNWKKITKPVRPDLIFDKISGKEDYALFDFKLNVSRKIKFFNHPLFRTMLDNKLAQYLLLEKFMPKSFLATNKKELQKALEKIQTSVAVIKPLYGSGGFGIVIDKKNNILNRKVFFPVFVQEFVSSNLGIPGFSKKGWLADLRMIFINHNLVYALSRIARKGSLFTNFHQGATVVLVPNKSLPKTVRGIAKKIVNKLRVFPECHYSLDFIFSKSGKPLLIEMNTTPGFDLLHMVGTKKIKNRHLEEFAKLLN